jgi:hypothetical protein
MLVAQKSWSIFCAAGALLLLSWITLSAGHEAISLRRGESGFVVSENEWSMERRTSERSLSADKVTIGDVDEPLLDSSTNMTSSIDSKQQSEQIDSSICHSLSLNCLTSKLFILKIFAGLRLLTIRNVLVLKPCLSGPDELPIDHQSENPPPVPVSSKDNVTVEAE